MSWYLAVSFMEDISEMLQSELSNSWPLGTLAFPAGLVTICDISRLY
jgi:hypothetical protein